MKISRNSWHWKIQSWMPDEATNLCSYFWRVMFNLLCLPVLCLMGVFIAVGSLPVLAVGAVFYWMVRTRKRKHNKLPRWFWPLFVIINILTLVTVSSMAAIVPGIAPLFAMVCILGMIVTTIFLSEETRWMGNEHNEPSLLGSWLKAKKEKICPLIKYVD